MEDTQLLECTQAIIDQTDDNDERRLVGWLEIEDIKYEICEGTFKIGRDPATCDILLQNQKTISKEHAVIEAESACIFLMDLGSRNKTRLGKVAIKPHVRYALQGGEHLQFGIVKALYSKNNKSAENEEGNSSDGSESMLPSDDFISSPNKSCVNQSSDISVISPTPQVSSKFSQSKKLEGNSNSGDFVPETPGITIGDKQWNFSNIIRESPSSQSTPFPTNLRSSLKNFTSPAFLSPIANDSFNNNKMSILSEPDDLPSKSKKSVAFKLSYSGEEEINEDSSSNDSTDIEEFFNSADNAKSNSIKRQSFALKSKCNEDIFNMATQPYSVDSEKPLQLDLSNADANTQEVLLAFTRQDDLKEADNTQDILSAFEQPTQLGISSAKPDSTEAQTFQNFEANDKSFKSHTFASPKSRGTMSCVRKVAIIEDIHEVATQVFPEQTSCKKLSSAMKDHNEDEGCDKSYHKDNPTEPSMKSYKFLKGKTSSNVSDLGDDAKDNDIHEASTQILPSFKKLHKSSVQICGATGISRTIDNVDDLVSKKGEKLHEEQDNPNSYKVNNMDDTDVDLLPTNEDLKSTLPDTQVFSKSHLKSPEQETNEMNYSLPPTQVFSHSHLMDNALDQNNSQIISHSVTPEKCSDDLDETQVFCSQNIVNKVAQDVCDSNCNLPPTQVFSHSHLHSKDQNDPSISLSATQLFPQSHIECTDQNDPNNTLPPTQIFSLSHLQVKDHDGPNNSLSPTQIFSHSYLNGKENDDSNSSLPSTQIFSHSQLQDKDHHEPHSLPPTQIFSLSHLQDKDHDEPQSLPDTQKFSLSHIQGKDPDSNCSLPPTQLFSLSHLHGKDHNDLNCNLPPTQVFSNAYLAGKSSNKYELNGDTDDDNNSCSSETLLTIANEPNNSATISSAPNNCLDINISDSVYILQQKEDPKTGYNSDESTDIEDTEHLNFPSNQISTELLTDNAANCSNSLVKCVDSPDIIKNITENPKDECGYNSEGSTDLENELIPPNCGNDKLPNNLAIDKMLKVNADVHKSICNEEKSNISFDNDTYGYNSDESTDVEEELILSKCKVKSPISVDSAKCSPNKKQLKETTSPDTSLDMYDTPSELYPNLVVVVPTPLLDFMSENPKSPFNDSNDSQQSPYRRFHSDDQEDNVSDMADSDDDDNAMDKSQELFNLNSPCDAFSINSKSPRKKIESSLTSTPANKKFSLANIIGSNDNSTISFEGFNSDNRNTAKRNATDGCQSDTPTLSRHMTENDTPICIGAKNAGEMRRRKSSVMCKRKLIVTGSPIHSDNSAKNNNTDENASFEDEKISSNNICSVTNGSCKTVIDMSKVSENLPSDKVLEQPTSLEVNCLLNLDQQQVQNFHSAKTKENKVVSKGIIAEKAKKSDRNSNILPQTTRKGRRSIAPARYSPDRSCPYLKHDDLQKGQIMPQNKRTRNSKQKETISAVKKNDEVLESHLIVHSPENDVDKQKGKSCAGNNSSVNIVEQSHLIKTTLNDSQSANNCKIMPSNDNINSLIEDNPSIKLPKVNSSVVTSNKETLLHEPYQGTEVEVVKKNVSVTKNVSSCDLTIPQIIRTCKVRKSKASSDYEADLSSNKIKESKSIKISNSDKLLTSDSVTSVELPNRDIDQILGLSVENVGIAAHIKTGNKKLEIVEDPSMRVDKDKICDSECKIANTNHSEILKSSNLTIDNALTNTNISKENVIEDIETNNKGNCDKNGVKLIKSCVQEPLKKGIKKRGRPKKSLVLNAVEQKNEIHNVFPKPKLPTIDATMKNSSIVKDIICSNNDDNDETIEPLLRCTKNIYNKSLDRSEKIKRIITRGSTAEDFTNKDIVSDSMCFPFMKSTRNSCRSSAKKMHAACNENDSIPKNQNYYVNEKHSDANNIDKENQNKTLTRRTRNSCTVKPSIGNGLNKGIVSCGSEIIDSKDQPCTDVSISTNISNADPSLNNEYDLEIKSTTNSVRLKGNTLTASASNKILTSKHIVHVSEGEQSYSKDNLNTDEFTSKQDKIDHSIPSKPEALKCEVVEVSTKQNELRKSKRSVGKKPSSQLLQTETRTRCAGKRKASLMNVVIQNGESISSNMNVKREDLQTSNLNDLITNKKRKITMPSCETEENKHCPQDSKGNSKKSVTTEYITNENLINEEAEIKVSPAKCNLNSKPTRASCRGKNNNSAALSQRQKTKKSIEWKVSTNQESTKVDDQESSVQKGNKKLGNKVSTDKSKCKQGSSVFNKDENCTAESTPVCELSFASEASIAEMKCPKRKRNGSVIESASSVRSTRSKRGSSPSFSRETILWSPSQRQAMANKQPRVLFTSYKDNRDEKLIRNLGGSLVESVSECTVLVTNTVRRTCKFLASLGKGVPIVSTGWLVASKQAGNFVDPWQFLIVDKESEKKFGFNLKSALTISRKKRLFSGYSIYVTDSVMPPPDQMREIIECAGGEYLDTAPKMNAEKIIVISCKEDKDSWKCLKKLGLPILNAEFILSGLLKQQIKIKETLLADF